VGPKKTGPDYVLKKGRSQVNLKLERSFRAESSAKGEMSKIQVEREFKLLTSGQMEGKKGGVKGGDQRKKGGDKTTPFWNKHFQKKLAV